MINFQAVRGEMSDILEELYHPEATANEYEEKYAPLGGETKRIIDADTKKCHKEKTKAMLEQLAKKHKAGEGTEKAGYRPLVAEYDIAEAA